MNLFNGIINMDSRPSIVVRDGSDISENKYDKVLNNKFNDRFTENKRSSFNREYRNDDSYHRIIF